MNYVQPVLLVIVVYESKSHVLFNLFLKKPLTPKNHNPKIRTSYYTYYILYVHTMLQTYITLNNKHIHASQITSTHCNSKRC